MGIRDVHKIIIFSWADKDKGEVSTGRLLSAHDLCRLAVKTNQ